MMMVVMMMAVLMMAVMMIVVMEVMMMLAVLMMVVMAVMMKMMVVMAVMMMVIMVGDGDDVFGKIRSCWWWSQQAHGVPRLLRSSQQRQREAMLVGLLARMRVARQRQGRGHGRGHTATTTLAAASHDHESPSPPTYDDEDDDDDDAGTEYLFEPPVTQPATQPLDATIPTNLDGRYGGDAAAAAAAGDNDDDDDDDNEDDDGGGQDLTEPLLLMSKHDHYTWERGRGGGVTGIGTGTVTGGQWCGGRYRSGKRAWVALVVAMLSVVAIGMSTAVGRHHTPDPAPAPAPAPALPTPAPLPPAPPPPLPKGSLRW
jgi:hypothetical protein